MNSLLVDEKFWSDGPHRSRLESGTLIGVLKIDPGSSHWEVHPDGDELLYLLSGTMDVVIESEGKKGDHLGRFLFMHCSKKHMASNNSARAMSLTVYHPR